MHKLKLFFAPGACSRIPLIALEKIGVPFETELVAFMKGDHKSPQFTKLNPSGKIPVLMVGDVALSQNVSILTWLHEAYPDAGLLPDADTPLQKAQCLSLLARFSADLHPLVTRIRIPHFFCDIEGAPNRVAQIASTVMREQLEPIEDSLHRHEWVSGDAWSIIDAYLHWVWFRITGAGFDGAAFPKITAHYNKMVKMPAVEKALSREAEAEAFLEANGLMPNFVKPQTAAKENADGTR